MTQEYIIDEELVEIIEGQLKNKNCRTCPYEGGGINSGILAYIRSNPYNPQAERETVLDVDTIGTLLNLVEKDCSNLTTMERMAYRKAKRVEAELRRGE